MHSLPSSPARLQPSPTLVFLSVLAILAATADVVLAQQQFETTVAVANIRSEPNVSSRVVVKVPRGTVLDVQEIRGDWVSVTLQGADGVRKHGFIRSDLGRLEGDRRVSTASAPAEAPAAPQPAAPMPDENSPRSEAAAPIQRTGPPLEVSAQEVFEQRQWNDERDQNRSRIRRAKFMLIGGAAIVGMGAFLKAREAESGYQYVTNEGFSTVGVAFVIGAGVAGYGIFELVKAQARQNELETEGRQKGFLASVSRAGVSLSYRINF